MSPHQSDENRCSNDEKDGVSTPRSTTLGSRDAMASEPSQAGAGTSTAQPEGLGSNAVTKEGAATPPLELSGGTSSESKGNGATTASSSENGYLTGVRLYSLSAGLIFCVFLTMLNAGVVATAIPSITNQFNSVQDIGWYGTAYLLTNCTFQPLAGRIYTHQSLKWSYIAFISLFELGNLICGLAVSSKMLIVGRAIAGAGGAGMTNGALSILAHSAPLEKRPVLVSLITNVARVGSICGPVLGGALAEKVSWQWVFLINCPIGAAAAVVLFLIRMPERQDKESLRHDWKGFLKALDLRGFALFAPGCVLLLLALEWGGVTYAWNSGIIIGLLCAAAVMIVAFSVWERHAGENALIPISVLRIRAVWSGGILIFLQLGCMFLLSYYLPIWFQAVKQASPIDSGLMSLPSILSQMIVGVAAAYAVQRIGYFTPFAIAGCIVTAIGAGLMATFQPWTGPNIWIGYQILMGSGRGLAGQIALTGIQFAVPRAQVSLGSSVLTFSGNLGAAVFVGAGQTLFANLLMPAVLQYAPGVNPQDVINGGSTNIQAGTTPSERNGLLLAYNYALTRMFLLGCAASAFSLFFSFGLGWGNIKQKREQEKREKEARKQEA